MSKRPPASVRTRVRTTLALSLVVAAAAAGAAAVSAQEAGAPPAGGTAPVARNLVVSASAGPASEGFFGIAVSIAVESEERGWVGRWAYAEEMDLLGPSPALAVWDLSILRAAVVRRGILQVRAGAGPALTGGMNRGEYLRTDPGWWGTSNYAKEPFYTAGVVGAANLTAAVLPFLGLGIGISGNANLERPYAVGTLHIAVGGLR